MDNDIPLYCNNFGLSTGNGVTFILEFRFQEPPPNPTQTGELKTFSRVSIDRIGLERFGILIQNALKTPPSGSGHSQKSSDPPPRI